jgi:cation-transporting P-type ATPase 13A2
MISIKKKEAAIDFLDVQGRKKNIIGRLYITLCILTLGILHIICKLFPNIKIILTSVQCRLKYSDCVVVTNKYNKVEFRDIKEYKILKSMNLSKYIHNDRVRVLDTEYGRFLYNHSLNRFVISSFILNEKESLKSRINTKLYLTDEEETQELIENEILYGKNGYNLRLPSILSILMESTFNLTVFINLFCIVLWFKIDYEMYAAIISIFFTYGYVEAIISEIRMKLNLENFKKQKSILTFRNKKFTPISSDNIYPGDIVCIKPCEELCCDVVLLKGDIISDESFLTGESVPICKSASQKSIVYSGTSILKSVCTTSSNEDINSESLHRVLNLINPDKNGNCNDKFFEESCGFAIGVVIGTGFNTLRGKIMKDIINPKPVYISFLHKAYRNIVYLIMISFILSLFLYFHLKFNLEWDFDKCMTFSLDLFFSLASPTLYASLTIGIQISNNNLKKEGITCNNLDRIYMGSNVEIAIFDKTGTLTSDGMDLTYIDTCTDCYTDIKQVDMITRMGLSSCHSVYELEGKYSGDTLDIQMFIFSESKLEYDNENIRNIIIGRDNNILGPFLKEYDDETEVLFYQDTEKDDIKKDTEKDTEKDDIKKDDIKKDTEKDNEKDNEKDDIKKDTEKDTEKDKSSSEKIQKEISIIKTVDFTSESRKMSVIVKDGNKRFLFVKGSPDKIGSMISKKPDNYEDNVRDHSLNGYRVIAMAYKEINEDYKGNLEEDETNLNYLCFIVFSNKLKAESIPVIRELRNAEIQTKICTGDNILTAISVSRECGLIDENTTVMFPVVEDNCKNIYDVEWVCLGGSDLFFDKIKLAVYKNNHKEFSDDFIIACEGKDYEFFSNTYYHSFILEKGRIFARFSPAQKKSLVEDYRDINKSVLFCGDGANDSGAIGTADVGIALTHNEASLASSFVSQTIEIIPTLIKECRNAYVSSIARYKFVLVSGVLTYFNMLFMVCKNKFYTDLQSLHIDVFLIIPISYFLSSFARSDKLSISRPNISVNSDISMNGMIFIITPMILFNYLTTLLESKYDIYNTISLTSTYLFFINSFQVIFSSLVLSDCTPDREGLKDNLWLLIVSVSFSLFNFILLFILYIFSSDSFLIRKYNFKDISGVDLLTIMMMIFFNGLFCYGIFLLKSLYKKGSK